MYKSISPEIKKIQLDTALYQLHKEGIERSEFGMDNSPELLDGAFGLYSTADLKKNIGPIKTEYFRIALIRSGTANFNIGLEKYQPVRNSIVFGFPGQIFSLYDPVKDFFAYYMLFSEKFISETFLLKNKRQQFPFLNYSGVQCFQLSDEIAGDVQNIILKMNDEIKIKKPGCIDMIKLYLQQILVNANRSYGNMLLARQGINNSAENLFSSFVKLVSQHFLTIRKVSEYATMLYVSPDHLNRAIKSNCDKTAHELINEMILIEAKAYLVHSKISVAEIAYKLAFADPSHFNKFFKKLSGCNPLQFRNKSE